MHRHHILQLTIVLMLIAAICASAIAITGHPMSAIGSQRWIAILTLSLTITAIIQIGHRRGMSLRNMRFPIIIASLSIIGTWVVAEALHKYIAVRTSQMEREIEAGHPTRDQ